MAISAEYYAYIKSDAWKRRADAAKDRAGWRCQVCYSDGLLDAHHRTYDRLGNEMDSDITVLCRECHKLYEFARKFEKRKSEKKPAAEVAPVQAISAEEMAFKNRALRLWQRVSGQSPTVWKALCEAKMAQLNDVPSENRFVLSVECGTDQGHLAETVLDHAIYLARVATSTLQQPTTVEITLGGQPFPF
jgi:hypothetical protein